MPCLPVAYAYCIRRHILLIALPICIHSGCQSPPTHTHTLKYAVFYEGVFKDRPLDVAILLVLHISRKHHSQKLWWMFPGLVQWPRTVQKYFSLYGGLTLYSNSERNNCMIGELLSATSIMLRLWRISCFFCFSYTSIFSFNILGSQFFAAPESSSLIVTSSDFTTCSHCLVRLHSNKGEIT